MNLRSGINKDFHELQPKKKKPTKKHTGEDETRSMAAQGEMHKLFAELKESLCQEFQVLKMELKDFRRETERDIQKIMQQTADLNEKVNATTTRVEHLESRVSDLDDAGANNQQTMEWMKSRIDELIEQTEYLESKSRQNNMCIYNIAEGSEGKDMVGFLTKLIKELGVHDELNILHAHRTYKERENFDRPIIIAFLENDMKMRVMQAAWTKKKVMFEDTRIYFEHDFTTKVRKQRAMYKPIRKQLKDQGIKSHIVAPAKLKIFHEDDSTTTFPNPGAATQALEEKGLYKAE